MEEIINSVMQSPENTNPNVLRGQLSKIADSSDSGTLVVHATATDDGYGNTIYTLDKTAAEIIAAARVGYVVLDMYDGFEEPSSVLPLNTAWFDSKGNIFYFRFGDGGGSSLTAGASTGNDYPVSEGNK